MSQAVFEANIGRSRVRGVGKQGVATSKAAFSRLELWREIRFCVPILLTLWALSQEESVAKFVAYHVVEATTSTPGVDELAIRRQRIERLLGGDGVLIAEIVESPSQLPRYLRLKHAVRAAWTNHAKLIVTGIRPENRSPDVINEDDLCVVDVQSLNRSELRRFLLQKPTERSKKNASADRSRSTKIGLERAKSRGAVLGNRLARALQPKASRAASAAAEEFRAQLRIRILEDHREGLSLRAIADKLNREGVPTARGRSWHASSVGKILTEAKEGPQ